MIQRGTYIRIQSELNDWINFILIIENAAEIDEAEKVIEIAYDAWFTSESDETMSDFICNSLYEAGIEHSIYFSEEEAE